MISSIPFCLVSPLAVMSANEGYQRPISQVGIDGRISFFFFLCDKRSHLYNFLACCFFKDTVGMTFTCRKNRRISFSPYHQVGRQKYDVPLRKCREHLSSRKKLPLLSLLPVVWHFINNLFTDKTIGSVHGYISIDKVPVLQFGKVVDNGFRASGSNKYLQPFCVGSFQRLDGRRRYTVSFKTDQRSVYIKKIKLSS